jgi:hypothetical protein
VGRAAAAADIAWVRAAAGIAWERLEGERTYVGRALPFSVDQIRACTMVEKACPLSHTCHLEKAIDINYTMHYPFLSFLEINDN